MMHDAIQPSELILTQRGAVYHLDLLPNEIADTIITVGDPGRVSDVSMHFDRIEHRSENREFVTHTGYIGSKRLSVISTGIGTDNIDIVLNELDALVNIDLQTRTVKANTTALTIVRLGTSGSLQADIDVDSMVVSSFAIGLDNLIHYYETHQNAEENYILNEFSTHASLGRLRPYIAEGAIGLRNRFVHGYHHGITVTCPGFYAPQGRVLRGSLAYPSLIDSLSSFESRGQRVTNFEMETAGIYGLGKTLGHHCLSISAIVANRITRTFSANAHATVQSLIKKALLELTKE